MKEIYLIYARQLNLCKIGITKSSKSLKGRKGNIQTGCPVEIEVRELFTSEFPHKLERALHRRFSRHKCDEFSGQLKGEWFSLPLEDIFSFRETCIQIEGMFKSLKQAGNPFV